MLIWVSYRLVCQLALSFLGFKVNFRFGSLPREPNLPSLKGRWVDIEVDCEVQNTDCASDARAAHGHNSFILLHWYRLQDDCLSLPRNMTLNVDLYPYTFLASDAGSSLVTAQFFAHAQRIGRAWTPYQTSQPSYDFPIDSSSDNLCGLRSSNSLSRPFWPLINRHPAVLLKSGAVTWTSPEMPKPCFSWRNLNMWFL